MKLSIIVPCYNESKNIPLILEKFANVIKRDDVEVILVNNGSTDNSQMVLDELETFQNGIQNLKNCGLGDLKQLKSRERIIEKR